mmetsp:Transcript_67830/g.219164  ORF Transcript_67830/g.219164 Transcript_67830/m.219164 type:complete len:234 (-) Transcript_67830:466-1167(-)
MFESTTWGSRSATATRKAPRARWKAPCDVSSEGLQCCASSTRTRRGSGVLCASASASAANGAAPSPPRRPCRSLETVATSRLECWCPSWSKGSVMHRSAACRGSRCFKTSALSRTRKPASETAWATCCHAPGSPLQSHGIPPLLSRFASSPSTAPRCRSRAFCISRASSAEASCSCASAVPPRRAPLPRPRPRPGATASPELCRSTRSAIHRKKKAATFDTVRASRVAACCSA